MHVLVAVMVKGCPYAASKVPEAIAVLCPVMCHVRDLAVSLFNRQPKQQLIALCCKHLQHASCRCCSTVAAACVLTCAAGAILMKLVVPHC
jgi:hypothetical protein